ncbi:rod-binding protein [Oxalobacteraceae bacterium]|nr:rod-binding protein [Oxalobacteraceae bacterium]
MPLQTQLPPSLTQRLNGAAEQAPPVAPAADGPDTADPRYRAKATEAAVKFESFFIGQMLHQMRAATRAMAAEGSVFKDTVNDDMLDMADNLVADKMAGQRAFGIADAILRQLLPVQAAVSPAGQVNSEIPVEKVSPPLNRS